jgi:acetate---CoA ligase (ADP-forming) subunit beta
MEIIEKALKEGRSTLSEYESKQLLAKYDVPVAREILVQRREDLSAAAQDIGFPLVLKGCSPDLNHKTEMDVIRLDLRNESEALAAFDDITAKMNGTAGSVLVQEMVKGQRELLVGLKRDAQFGPCVMFGLGGILTEILKDVSFRLAPVELKDAKDMMSEIKGRKILDAVRGMEAVDPDILAKIIVNVGRMGVENESIREVDINPLIVRNGKPVAVDALIVVGG